MSISLCASFYAIYHCLLFIFMLISMNTNYWASNGLQNRGLWNQCSYEKNLTVIEGNRTSFYGGTCCSPVKYEGNYSRKKSFRVQISYYFVNDNLHQILTFSRLYLIY